MIEGGRAISLGLAYIDGKIHSDGIHLPLKGEELHGFLDNHSEAVLSSGGAIPNTVTTFIRLVDKPDITLFSCIGNDQRGDLFAKHLDRRLGKPQLSTQNPTGLWVGVYDQRRIIEHRDFFGASVDLNVSKRDLQTSRNMMFITDIDSCSIPQLRDQIGLSLESVDDNAVFALSLSGANNRESVQNALTFTPWEPGIVFGTASELAHMTSKSSLAEALSTAFPETRLLVVTQGEKGSIIRFEGKIFDVPALFVPDEKIVDEGGAGDSYMGAMLALLCNTKYSHWTYDDVKLAAHIASYASALVIQSPQSRLTVAMALQVTDYKNAIISNTNMNQL